MRFAFGLACLVAAVPWATALDTTLNVSQIVWSPTCEHAERQCIGTPNIARLSPSSLLATHDLYNLKDPTGTVFVYRSSDAPAHREWHLVAEIKGLYWAEFIFTGDVLYLLGTTSSLQNGSSVAVSRCLDASGGNWSAPRTILPAGPGQAYHASGAGAATDGSRLYRSVELEERGLCTSRGQDIELSPLILSAPLSCPDLRDPSCWTASKPLCWQSEWRLPGGYESGATRVRPWEEGTTIVDSETNNIYVVMRLDKDGLGRDCNAAALLQLHGSQLEFKQMLDSFPSGCSRFVIRYHPPSQLYYSLTNPVAPPRTNTGAKPDPCGQRDVLVLAVSHDLVHWRQCRTVLTDDTGLSAAWYTPHNTSSLLVGFQYVHWVFDQHDILYTVRAAYRGARDSGQANRYLFGRLEDFASQCSE